MRGGFRLGYAPSPEHPPLDSASATGCTTVPDALSLVVWRRFFAASCSGALPEGAHCFLLKTEPQNPKNQTRETTRAKTYPTGPSGPTLRGAI